jgi:hypothetical protein
MFFPTSMIALMAPFRNYYCYYYYYYCISGDSKDIRSLSDIKLLSLKSYLFITVENVSRCIDTLNLYPYRIFLYDHHHHMAVQPKSVPVLPCWGFVIITFLQGWIVSPAPNPQPGGPGLCIYDPRRQGGPAIPPGTGYPF